MESYDEFLGLMKNGWEGIIEFTKHEKTKNKKVLSPRSVAFSMGFLGDIGGAGLAYSISNQDHPIEGAKFKVIENGIFIQLENFKREELMIKWGDIINIHKLNKGRPDLVSLIMTDDIELILSAPLKEGFFSVEYFRDYFINYVNKRSCSKIQKEK